jgi:hypothetical protein
LFSSSEEGTSEGLIESLGKAIKRSLISSKVREEGRLFSDVISKFLILSDYIFAMLLENNVTIDWTC